MELFYFSQVLTKFSKVKGEIQLFKRFSINLDCMLAFFDNLNSISTTETGNNYFGQLLKSICGNFPFSAAYLYVRVGTGEFVEIALHSTGNFTFRETSSLTALLSKTASKNKKGKVSIIPSRSLSGCFPSETSVFTGRACLLSINPLQDFSLYFLCVSDLKLPGKKELAALTVILELELKRRITLYPSLVTDCFMGTEQGFINNTLVQLPPTQSDFEQRYSALFEHSPECIYIHDMQGVFYEANPAALELMGYQKEDFGNVTFFDILDESQVELAFKNSQDLLHQTTSAPAFIYKVKKKTGEFLFLEVKSTLIPYSGEKIAVLGIARDVTERVLAEEELTRRESIFDLIAENLPMIMYAIDTEGIFTFSHGSGLRLIGLRPGQVVGLSALEMYKDYPDIIHGLKTSLQGGKLHQTVVVNGLHLDTFYSPLINADNQLVGAVGIAFDITNEVITRQVIKESEETFRILVDNSSDLIVKVDTEGKFIYVNPAYMAMFGKTREELLGRPFIPLVHEDDREETNKKMELLYVPPYKTYIEQRAYTVDGWRWLAWSDSSIIDEQGKVKEIIGIGRDITETKKHEMALGQLNNYLLSLNTRLTEAEKNQRELNAQKDMLLSIIAHDLKNPFHHIINLSAILSESIINDDKKRMLRYSDIIKNASNQAYALLENLLDWSRSQTGTMQVRNVLIDLNAFINEIIPPLELTARNKEIGLTMEVPRMVMIYADFNMMQTVMRNLISNAIKFTGRGGSIAISAREDEEHVLIQIKDDGIGMTDEDVQGVFRLDKKVSGIGTAGEKGSGLGLILCKDFVEKNNGTIEVFSKLGEGTTIQLTFPKH